MMSANNLGDAFSVVQSFKRTTVLFADECQQINSYLTVAR